MNTTPHEERKVLTDEKRAEFIKRWTSATTERARSAVVPELFEYVPVGEERRKFVAGVLSINEYTAELHSTLASAGDSVGALWERVDGDERMTMRTAVELLRKTRKAYRVVSVSEEQVKSTLAEYDKLPSRVVDGHTVRAASAAAFRPGRKEKASPSSDVDDTEQKFWRGIREAMAGYLQRKTVGLDPLVINQMFAEATADIDTMAKSWQSRLLRLGKRIDVKQVEVTRACYTLSVSPPNKGKPVDINTARTNFKRLAREYHPDTGGQGGDNYNNVIAAWEVLQAYNAQFEKEKTA